MSAEDAPVRPAAERALLTEAAELGLHGLVQAWDEMGREAWIPELIRIERAERGRRSLERRQRAAQLGTFRSLADFDWAWPKAIDREQIEELMRLEFLEAKTNIVLIGPNGVGKTMIAKNLADAAILGGKRARFVTAAKLLNDLGSQMTTADRTRRLRRYCHPELLVIDEVGYLAYSSEHADLLFELVNERYEKASTVITTNKPFQSWNEVFPNAACVTALIDRLVHHSAILSIEGESWRLREAEAEKATRAKKRPVRKRRKE